MQLDGRQRVIIEGVQPEIDGGRFPAKRVEGDKVVVEADIFADGHDLIAAVLLHRGPKQTAWTEVRMKPLPNDRWRASFPVHDLGSHTFTIRAWIDHFATWHRDLKKRLAAEQDLEVQLQVGSRLIEAAATRATGRDKRRLHEFLADLDGSGDPAHKARDLFDDDLVAMVRRNSERSFMTSYERELTVEVDRRKAAFSTWYELFPRSTGKSPADHGTFRTTAAKLSAIARMGFDVLYLPPIHPIGTAHRKGRNNAVAAEAGDLGSPWAIGSAEGGHNAIHPQLGTLADFRIFRQKAAALGLELALDMAFQASPDHPFVREHPQWFHTLPDGSIQYAENPPKKYQDIYPFHFETEQWEGLWAALRDTFLFWINEGVRIFRVDNPHTKPLPFWEWVIREIKRDHPDVIFLAEAFTRPKIMYRLAKGGFSQSYTYFAWRNTKSELVEYFEEICRPPVSDFFRPNAWPNTPDILPEYLQYGGKPAFTIRLILAATLSANYGIYGPPFERAIGAARELGSEEYLHSEKYQLQQWSDRDETSQELIAVVNRIRRENSALHRNDTLKFHTTTNDDILCFSKSAEDGANIILTVVNLDPYNAQSGWLELDLKELDLDEKRPFQVHDLLSNARFSWHGPRNFVQLNPHVVPAHIFRIRRRVRSEEDFEYFL